jgi:hypothetical protein
MVVSCGVSGYLGKFEKDGLLLVIFEFADHFDSCDLVRMASLM